MLILDEYMFCSSDEEVVIDPLAEMEHKETNPPPVAKATKKGKKNRKRDDDL